MNGLRFFASGAVASLALLAIPQQAAAHFRIDAPPSPEPWMTQDSLGSPQKYGPCGNESGGTATGVVTTLVAGSTVQLEWAEVVPHDGWYRIALGADRNQFGIPPVVVDSMGDSADAGIETPPVAPVLVDGLFPHQAADITSGKVWQYTLTLPNQPCMGCTIQVLQFMNHHASNVSDGGPDGYFYHHCMDVNVVAADAGSASAADAGTVIVLGPGDAGTTSRDAAVDATVVGSGSSGTSPTGSPTGTSTGTGPTGSPTGTSATSNTPPSTVGADASTTTSASNGGNGGGAASPADGGAAAAPAMTSQGGCAISSRPASGAGFAAVGGALAVLAFGRRRRRDHAAR